MDPSTANSITPWFYLYLLAMTLALCAFMRHMHKRAVRGEFKAHENYQLMLEERVRYSQLRTDVRTCNLMTPEDVDLMRVELQAKQDLNELLQEQVAQWELWGAQQEDTEVEASA